MVVWGSLEFTVCGETNEGLRLSNPDRGSLGIPDRMRNSGIYCIQSEGEVMTLTSQVIRRQLQFDGICGEK